MKTYINIDRTVEHGCCFPLPVSGRADTNFEMLIHGRACPEVYSVHKPMARATNIETLSPSLGRCSNPLEMPNVDFSLAARTLLRGKHCIFYKEVLIWCSPALVMSIQVRAL